MSTRRPKPKPINRNILSDKQKQILDMVERKNQKFYAGLDVISQHHAYIKKCVDSRVCPECGHNLIYNENWSIMRWIWKYASKKSNCTCGHCGYIYEYSHYNGLVPKGG